MKEKDLTIQNTKSLTKKAKEPKEIAVKDKNTALVKSKSSTTKTKTSTTTAKKNSTKTTAKKSANTKKTTTKSSTKKSTVSKKSTVKKSDIAVHANEYFDLPYRYNETIVKLLAQTPKRLFVYWDISNKDRVNYIKNFGEEFFNQTLPFLRITNETLNYTFDVEINDFANSWYININDDNCVYSIELYRKFKDITFNESNNHSNKNENIIFIASSNKMDAPNGKTLETYPRTIMYKNIKTNEVSYKEIDIQEFYNTFFKNENEEILKNPSSSK